jgi:hypothetical protein
VAHIRGAYRKDDGYRSSPCMVLKELSRSVRYQSWLMAIYILSVIKPELLSVIKPELVTAFFPS